MPPAAMWELLSYVVTVVGLPLAIFVFVVEQRKERANEENEIQQLLSDSYADFLKVVIENADLQLMTRTEAPSYLPEQRERALALYSILIALFERAYIMAYVPELRGRKARLWASWEDTMLEWCRREDFRAYLPALLVGEDEDFAKYIQALAAKPVRQMKER